MISVSDQGQLVFAFRYILPSWNHGHNFRLAQMINPPTPTAVETDLFADIKQYALPDLGHF